jgi:hypothetical protein
MTAPPAVSVAAEARLHKERRRRVGAIIAVVVMVVILVGAAIGAASRQASGGKSFTATVGPAASTGIRVSATLSGDSESAPKLVIHLGAVGR